MKHREATPRDIKHFERIATEPKTAEVMESLGQQLCTNFERPSRVFLEIAANKLGLPYELMDAFHEWFRFDRVAQPATVEVAHPYPNREPGVNRQSEISNGLCMRQ